MMITSAKHGPWPLDVLVSDHRLGGLSHACVVRIGKIAALDSRVATRIGELASPDRAKVSAALRAVLDRALAG